MSKVKFHMRQLTGDLSMFCKFFPPVKGNGLDQFGREIFQNPVKHLGNLSGFLAVTNTSQQIPGTPVYQGNDIYFVKAAVNKISFPMTKLASGFRRFRPLFNGLVYEVLRVFMGFLLTPPPLAAQIFAHRIAAQSVFPHPFFFHRPILDCTIDGVIAYSRDHC